LAAAGSCWGPVYAFGGNFSRLIGTLLRSPGLTPGPTWGGIGFGAKGELPALIPCPKGLAQF
jgi:hypothetical protein